MGPHQRREQLHHEISRVIRHHYRNKCGGSAVLASTHDGAVLRIPTVEDDGCVEDLFQVVVMVLPLGRRLTQGRPRGARSEEDWQRPYVGREEEGESCAK